MVEPSKESQRSLIMRSNGKMQTQGEVSVSPTNSPKLMLAHKSGHMPKMRLPRCRNTRLCPHCPWPRRAGGSRVAAFLECVAVSCAQAWGSAAVGSWSSAGGSGQGCLPSQGLLAPPTPALSHLISRDTPSPPGCCPILTEIRLCCVGDSWALTLIALCFCLKCSAKSTWKSHLLPEAP